MIRKNKQSYQFENNLWLMSPSWEIWSDWEQNTSIRQKQMYFDSKLGNIYHAFKFHTQIREKNASSLMQFRYINYYLLVGAHVTRNNINLKLLSVHGPSQTFNIKADRSCHWYAQLWQAV